MSNGTYQCTICGKTGDDEVPACEHSPGHIHYDSGWLVPEKEVENLRAELAAAKAEVERLKVELNHEKEAKKFRSNLDHETFMTLRADLDRYRRALELALYYVEGDATYEGVKEKVSRILEGKE